jgi:hypothetical protein
MHLVVDLANQIILANISNESLDSWLQRIKKRINFVTLIAKRWRLCPIFVCDVGYITPEVQLKWKLRREKELERGLRKIPYCADTMVCEIILEMGLDLVYDSRYNADDIVATIANMHPQSIILSRDMDYFRYDQGMFASRVFYIGEERKMTQLTPKDTREPLSTIRMYFPIFAQSFSDFFKIRDCEDYIRGTSYPDGEKKSCVCLHYLTQKYRRMLYSNNVREVFPMWQDRVVWYDNIVEPLDEFFPESLPIIVNDVISNINADHMNTKFRMTVVLMACELMAVQSNTSLLYNLNNYFSNSSF